MNQYEAMFLFDPTFGNTFEKCEKEIRRLMERAQGEVLICRKWDERRLAFKIKGRKRGIYALVYFKAASEKIASLERDAQLSEPILRLLVLRADTLPREEVERMRSDRDEAEAKTRDDAAEPVEPSAEPVLKEGESATKPIPEEESVAAETAVADPSERAGADDI